MNFKLRLLVLGAVAAAVIPSAFAEDGAAQHFQGTIIGVTGTILTVQAPSGTTMAVRLADDAKITTAVPAAATDLKPGTYVGVTERAGEDGKPTADEVHILPNAMRGFNEGEKPWDSSKKTRMTNGAVGDQAEATKTSTLVVTFKGGQAAIALTPRTQITRFEAGTSGDLKIGNHVMIPKGAAGAGGAVQTRAILVGKDGLVLAM